MKNIFIITLGTREIQFRKEKLTRAGFSFPEKGKRTLTLPCVPDSGFRVSENEDYPDFLICSEPRIAGKNILDNWEHFSPVIELPLIQHAYDSIVKDCTINRLILVYTDQGDLDISIEQHKRNFCRDTVYFREIIRKKLLPNGLPQEDEPADIVIETRTTDIDYQYNDFASKCKSLFDDADNIQQIFLLAQGGIDQINHALTLQLIQAFGSKVKLWQQAEGDVSRKLEFPFLFISDLNKQKILKHLQDYDFGFINKSLTNNKVIIHLSQYASARLQLKHDTVKCNLDFLQNRIDTSLFSKIFEDINVLNDKKKLSDLYISAKIALLHENFGDFVWRLFTIAENLFAVLLNIDLSMVKRTFKPSLGFNQENADLINFLRSIDPGMPESLKKKAVALNNPNRRIFFEVFCSQHPDLISENDKYLRIYNMLELLSKQRNNLAHDLKPVKKETLIGLLGQNYGTAGITDDLDGILNIASFGIFDEIRLKIIELLE